MTYSVGFNAALALTNYKDLHAPQPSLIPMNRKVGT